MAIDPPYRFDPFQNIVNVNWGKPTRWKSHFTIYENINTNGTWKTDHYEFTYGDVNTPGGTVLETYWIWLAAYGAPHGVRSSNLDPTALFSDGQDMATRDLNAIFTIPGAQDGLNWHLDDGTTFDALGGGTIKVTWNCWRWFGFDETLIEGDPGYIPESGFNTLPERYYGPLTYYNFRASIWGTPRSEP